jgi:ribosomal protein S18 acetylase RimI-like enzyme
VIFSLIDPLLSYSKLDEVIALDHNFMSYAWSEKQWRGIEECQHMLFVAESEHIAGFALYQLSRQEELAHLLKIVVAPTKQGQKSKDFFAMQKSHLAQIGLKRIYLEVAETNLRALSFYNKQGFSLLHKAKGYYSDGATALMVELTL